MSTIFNPTDVTETIGLTDLSDVTISSVADNDLLQYNSASGEWENTTFAAFNAALDHGSLLGLADDDHTQYHTDARADTWLAANHETTYNHANYDTAYGWGDHSGLYEVAGSIATHAAIADAHHAKYTDAEAIAAIQGDASWNATEWDTAYSWGDHALAGYLTTVDISTNTNLAVASPVTLTDDTVGFDFSTNNTWTGTFTHQNATDSTTAFQILDADGGNPVFNVDTTNERVGIGTDSPGAGQTLDIRATGNGNINLSTGGHASVTLEKGNTSSQSFVLFKRGGSLRWTFGTPDSDDFGNGDDQFILASSPATPEFYIQKTQFLNIGSIDLRIDTDSKKILMGAAQDFEIFFDGTYGRLTGTGDTICIGDIPSDSVEIEGDGDVNFVGGAGLQFGGISFYNNSTADTIATATLTQLTRFDTNNPSNGSCTPDHTNDHITVGKAGMYYISMDVSFSGDGSVEWTGGVYKNNGATQLTNLQTSRKLGAAGDVGPAGVSGIVDLAANDTIEVWFQHTAGVNKDITVKHCALSVVQIGGT